MVAWRMARSEMRSWVLLLAFANTSMWTPTVGETLDMLYILLVALAWLWRDKRWCSALCLGLAIASKQIAWFFVPFYVIMLWKQHNPMEAVKRLSIAGSIALLCNAPFILWSPHLWLAGVLTPIADPMFPLGTGIIALSTGHLLPYFPT